MQEIICLTGISGSGKSTIAKSIVEQNANDYVIVNRDKMREMLFGYGEDNIHEYYSLDDRSVKEEIVSSACDIIIRKLLDDGKSIVVDNTHLEIKYIDMLKMYNVPVKIVFVDVDADIAIMRDQQRKRQVGEEIIRKQAELYYALRNEIVDNIGAETTINFFIPDVVDKYRMNIIRCKSAFLKNN